MAIDPTNGYCTGDELKAALGVSGTGDDVALERAIETASRAIDTYCDRRFWQDPEDTVRYFTPDDPHMLRLGPHRTSADVVTVTEIAVDDGNLGTYTRELIVGTDVYLGPRSAQVEGRGYDRVVVTGQLRAWRRGWPDSVRITGQFGWPSIPEDVREATILQASRIWKRVREAPFGVAGISLDGGGIRLLSKLDPDVELLVHPYARHTVA